MIKPLLDNYACLTCKTIFKPKPKSEGWAAVALLGIVTAFTSALILPLGLVFFVLMVIAIVKASKTGKVCTCCGGAETVPVLSPAGRVIYAEATKETRTTKAAGGHNRP